MAAAAPPAAAAAAVAAVASTKPNPKSMQSAAAGVGACGVESGEVAVLLAEADRLAAELIDDGGGC
jgi:hypothetical protein